MQSNSFSISRGKNRADVYVLINGKFLHKSVEGFPVIPEPWARKISNPDFIGLQTIVVPLQPISKSRSNYETILEYNVNEIKSVTTLIEPAAKCPDSEHEKFYEAINRILQIKGGTNNPVSAVGKQAVSMPNFYIPFYPSATIDEILTELHYATNILDKKALKTVLSHENTF